MSHYNLGFQVTFLENFDLRTTSTVSHTLTLRSTATVRHAKRKMLLNTNGEQGILGGQGSS